MVDDGRALTVVDDGRALTVVEDGRMTTFEVVLVRVREKELREVEALATVEVVGPVPGVWIVTVGK